MGTAETDSNLCIEIFAHGFASRGIPFFLFASLIIIQHFFDFNPLCERRLRTFGIVLFPYSDIISPLSVTIF